MAEVIHQNTENLALDQQYQRENIILFDNTNQNILSPNIF